MQQIVALSLAFAAAALSLLAASDEGQSVSPFGWPAVVVVHALATLPLAVVAARVACAVWPLLRHRWAVVLLLPVGLLLAWWTVQHGAALGPRLAQHDVGSLARTAFCILWPLALQLPWTLLAQQHGSERSAPSDWQPRRELGLSAAAVAIAVILPSAYVDDVFRRRTVEVRDTLAQGQLVKAVGLLKRLEQIGASQAMLSVDQRLLRPADALDACRQKVTSQRAKLKALERRQPADQLQADQRQIEMAEIHRSLGKYDAARNALADLANRHPQAAELMAFIHRDQQQWVQSARWFRRAARPLSGADSAQGELRETRRLDDLAYVLRAQRKFREIETLYIEAIDRVPRQEAHFRFRLGTHYQWVGRPLEARRQWQTAARLDPARFAKPADDAVLGELNSYTPGCLLGPLHAQRGTD